MDEIFFFLHIFLNSYYIYKDISFFYGNKKLFFTIKNKRQYVVI